jgi:serine/threonine-protein kinase RsbW
MQIIIRNQLSEINRVNQMFEDLSKPWNLSLRIEAQLNLILDELLSNIIKYAYNDKDCHDIEVNIEIKDKRIYIQVIDDGLEFDPLEVPEPDLNPNLEERQVGGLGIHIIKNLTQEFHYYRRGGQNIQFLVKSLDS